MIISTLGHPQANGQVELSKNIIINNLKKKLVEGKGRWAEEFPCSVEDGVVYRSLR